MATDNDKFQFHKGTIRTQRLPPRPSPHWHFNSIKVQLEQLLEGDSSMSIDNFNSIKVQLEQLMWKKLYNQKKFQFHKGTIRT